MIPKYGDELASPWPDAPEQPIVRFSRDVLGFEPWPRQQAILNAIYAEDVRTAILRLGRRSGKGRTAALIGTFEGTANAPAHLPYVPEGEMPAIVVVATSQPQARVVHRFMSTWLHRPALKGLIARETEDTIELTTGMTLLTLPCTARSTRGYSVAVLVMDEAACF